MSRTKAMDLVCRHGRVASLLVAALIGLALWLAFRTPSLLDQAPPSEEMARITETVLAYERGERSWLKLPPELVSDVKRAWAACSEQQLKTVSYRVRTGDPPKKLPVTLPASLKQRMDDARMATIRRTCTGKLLATLMRIPWSPGRELELQLNNTFGTVPVAHEVELVWLRFRGHRQGGVVVRCLFWLGSSSRRGTSLSRSQFWVEEDFLMRRQGGTWRIAETKYMADYLPPSHNAGVFTSWGPNSERSGRQVAEGGPDGL